MDNWLNDNLNNLVTDTQNLLRIRSVKDTPETGAPFGRGISEALDYTLALAKKMGFVTNNNGGYYGYAEAGKGRPLLGILVHLDVVPEGEGWTYPPYGAEIADNKIYARGAVDDKSAAVAALYALKAAQMHGFSGRVRIIFGCDEESGWACINKYKECEEIPDLSFSPDSEFPLINTEKTILHLLLSANFDNEYSLSVQGGSRSNMVPDCARITTADKDIRSLLIAKGGKLQDNKIVFDGISAHASRLEYGRNALFAPIEALSQTSGQTKRLFTALNNALVNKLYGEGFNIAVQDEVSGKLTVNAGVLEVKEDTLDCVLDFRLPLSIDKETVISAVQNTLPDFSVTQLSYQPAHHVPADSELVSTLLDVYGKITGQPAAPKYTGGGTYARAFENSVAFGPVLPGREELAHQKDEYILIDDLLTMSRIYAHSIISLMRAKS